MAGKQPLVSVVVPTYDRKEYLREAIESVVAQTYQDWELIVVDDGSTDGTYSYLSTLTDSRIRAISLEHRGNPARARNAGIERANGHYVAFLDSDDVWDAQKLEMQIRDLRAHSMCRWAYSRFSNIDDLGKETAVSEWPNVGWVPCFGWILKDLVCMRTGVVTSTVVVEAALLREVGGFDESFTLSEDYDLWFRLAMLAAASSVNKPLMGYRRHPGRIRHRHPRVYVDWIRALEYVIVRTDCPDIQAICRRRCGDAMLRLTGVYRRLREYRRAFRTTTAALRYEAKPASWFLEMLKTLVHWITPEALVRGWETRRKSARLVAPELTPIEGGKPNGRPE